MTLDFKICTNKDIDLLVEISRSTFIAAFEDDNNPKDFIDYINSAFSKVTLEKELLNSNSTFFFVYHNNTLVGYFKINEKEAQNEAFEMTSIELERIYVYKTFQRKNIGKYMLEKVIIIALQRQVNFIWLGVWEKNLKAIRFYQKNGFAKFGTHPYYIGKDKQTDWLMKLSLI